MPRVLHTPLTFPRSYRAAGRRVAILSRGTSPRLPFAFLSSCAASRRPMPPVCAVPSTATLPSGAAGCRFGSETGGFARSQEEAPGARLLPLAATRASCQPASAEPRAALGSARALLGLRPGQGWAALTSQSLTALHQMRPFGAPSLIFLLSQLSKTLLQTKRLHLGIQIQVAGTQMLSSHS